MSQTLFLTISAIGLMAALGTVLNRNLVHAALHLVAFFFIVACQFVMLEAEFLAAIQVLVYIGAVAILLMFAIMLTRNIQGDDTTTLTFSTALPGVATGLALFVLLCFAINAKVGPERHSPWKATQARSSVADAPGKPASPRAAAINNMGKAVGDEMMTRFVVPFEVAGLLLTAALVGAIAIAYREGDGDTLLMRVRDRSTGATEPDTTPPATGNFGDGDGDGDGNGQAPRDAPRTTALIPPGR